jgi:antitoxin YobK
MPSWSDELARVIAASSDAHFGSTDDAPSDEWIERAEARLGLRLPPSYRWWLKNYGGGDVHGEEIFSIYGVDFDEAVGGDLVFANEHRQLKSQRVAICDTGGDEEFYFDTSSRDSDGEYRIVVFEHPDYESVYADNFGEFLGKRIEFFARRSY